MWAQTRSRQTDTSLNRNKNLTHVVTLISIIYVFQVLTLYPTLPTHILKCLSTNHLAPCASDMYKSLLQQQRLEHTIDGEQTPPTELQLATGWANRWQPVVVKALCCDVTLLRNNASSYLLPCTLRCFPQAVHTLLTALDFSVPEHLRAWVCITSAHRAVSGQSPWASENPVTVKTLHLALSCLDDCVRLAAFNLLCCSPKTKEAPSAVEYSAMTGFLPLNLNSESSPFRQQLQAGVRKFLVRLRDSCMAGLKNPKNKNGPAEEEKKELEQGFGRTCESF